VAFSKGSDFIVKVGNGAGTEVFAALAGQVSASVSSSADRIDTSNKADGAYGSSIAGKLNISVSVSGITDWDDDALQRVESQYTARAPINLEITQSTGARKEAGSFSILSFELSGDDNDVQKYSISFQSIGALTITQNA
jgi:TP901-1 family phage major tail protein